MKKILQLFVLACITTMNAQEWIQLPDFPGTARMSSVATAIGNKGYLANARMIGNNAGFLRDFWEWDSVTGIWTQKQDYPGEGAEACIMFSLSGKIYLGFGANNTNYKSDLWEWNPASEEWLQKASIPEGRAGASSFVIGSKAYVFSGGVNNSASGSKTLWEYDNIADNWVQKTDCPALAQFEMPSFVIGTKAYVFAANTDLWVWDSLTDTWADKTDIPETIVIQGSGFATGGYGYVLNVDNTRQHAWRYDPINDSWTQLSDTANGSPSLYANFQIGGSDYIVTGIENGFTQKEFWQFTPDAVLSAEAPEILSTTVYPNPFSNTTVIHLGKQQPYTLAITNQLGQRLSISKGNAQDITIEGERFSSGVYFATITSEKGMQTFKIVKK